MRVCDEPESVVDRELLDDEVLPSADALGGARDDFFVLVRGALVDATEGAGPFAIPDMAGRGGMGGVVR